MTDAQKMFFGVEQLEAIDEEMDQYMLQLKGPENKAQQ